MAASQRKPLKEACVKIGSGATPRGGKEAYRGGATALIRSQNVYNDLFSYDGLAYIDDAQAEELANVVVCEGDVLLNITGDSVARCCRAPADVIPARVNQHVAIIRPDASLLHAGFLRYVLVSPEYQHHLLALASAGATRNALTKGMIEALEVPLPPLPEQKRIAHVLGTLDDKIELNRRMNATLESISRALFKSWFVDFDPVRQKAAGKQPVGMDAQTAALFPDSFEDSEIGSIPQGWHVRKLKDLTSKLGSGSTPRGGSEVYVDRGPAIIRSQNIYDNEFCWAGLARLSDKSANELKNVEVLTDDVLMNITGDSILRTCVVDPAALPARVNQHVAIIRAIKGIPPRYLHLYLVRDSMKSFLLGLSAGATRHAITKGHLESIDVLKPCDQVLAAFERLTSPWFTLIDNSRSQSRTLAALRDTLLPKLLSGELRVPDDEQAVEEAIA
jgi:type I restriction enzyme S subunit